MFRHPEQDSFLPDGSWICNHKQHNKLSYVVVLSWNFLVLNNCAHDPSPSHARGSPEGSMQDRLNPDRTRGMNLISLFAKLFLRSTSL